MVVQPEGEKLTDRQKTGLRALHRAVVASDAVLEVRVVREKSRSRRPVFFPPPKRQSGACRRSQLEVNVFGTC